MVFTRPPQAFNENIVLDTTSTVHADFDIMTFQTFCKCATGKLGALIRLKNFRYTESFDGFLQRIDTKVGIQSVGDTPG